MAMKINKIICTPFALSLLVSAGMVQSQTELPTVTVTATREEEKISETPISVGVVPQRSIQITKPAHPLEILGQVPGVSISVTNGEGHQTAIRQGFTTSPVYLFLEDGIPIRATGNFNHNALYEVNIPSAGSIEVIRGPGSALHGSDAIGGIVNVLTKTPRANKGQDVSVELGGHGYRRLLGGFDTGSHGAGALRADVNLTHTDGWRTRTGYDRQSLNMRWDAGPDDRTIVKTILGYTKIDQETGANSALPWDLYQNNPTVNLRSPAYRKVDALRFSTAIERELGQGALLSFTPYFRGNKMELNGSFNFTGDARIENTEVFSLGLLAKYRKDLNDSVRSRVIAGLDLDHSPSSRKENKITLASTSIGPNSLYTQYTSYTIGDQMYNYDVAYQSASPYLHYEMSPSERLRLTAGLRYDSARYGMDNNRAAGYFTVSGREYYSPAEASASFSRLSPKLGATYALNPEHHVYVTYNQGFRTPSESQLFRGGRSASGGTQAARQAEALALFNASASLKAIKADQYEVGLRGAADKWNYDIVAYVLTKKDDLLSRRDDTGYSVQTNNGTTEHKGIEIGLGRSFTSRIRFDAALSYAKHTYKDWVTSSENFSGKEIESSPRFLGNARLTVRPVERVMTQLEWVRIGSYYLDAANTYGKYSGHDLFNFRASVDIAKQTSGFLRVMNLSDQRYADSASQSSATGGLYSPGLPRTVYAGIESRW
jgi:outer membrane receptor protein involved in Fe transport